MKILSVAVPCYNSQDYMEHCVETLLTGGEKVEIIIVNDGSKDDTAAIADRLAEKYPTIVKAIQGLRMRLVYSSKSLIVMTGLEKKLLRLY